MRVRRWLRVSAAAVLTLAVTAGASAQTTREEAIAQQEAGKAAKLQPYRPSPVERQFLVTLWDDLEIWRYQVYVENPALAQIDAKPFKAVRTWARQFYEVEPG